jgi:hypothetical protein
MGATERLFEQHERIIKLKKQLAQAEAKIKKLEARLIRTF